MSVRRYWSHRKGYREPLMGEFWSAFDSLLHRLIHQTDRYRHQYGIFGGLVVPYGEAMWEDYKLQRAIRERIGRDYYSPLKDHRKRPADEHHVLDFIEVFYDLAAKGHKQSFSDAVNELLQRFNQPYELVKGEIHYRGSEVLDEPIEELDRMVVKDDPLRKYLEAAQAAFFDARQDRRLEGLRALYDAFERLKTLREGDKKGSVAKIVGELARFEELRPQFDALFRAYTIIGNTTSIRHSERDKVFIDDDPVLIEHLFYSVWALVRAVLAREGKGSTRPEEADQALEQPAEA